MTNPTPEMQALYESVMKLKRQNRWMWTLGIVLILPMLSLLLLGQTSKTIEAQKFILKDKTGKVRAEFGVDQIMGIERTVPVLVLLDENGKETMCLHDRSLTFFNPNTGASQIRYGDDGVYSVGKTEASIVLGGTKGLFQVLWRQKGPVIDIVDQDGYSASLGVTELLADRTGESRTTSAASIILSGKGKKGTLESPMNFLCADHAEYLPSKRN